MTPAGLHIRMTEAGAQVGNCPDTATDHPAGRPSARSSGYPTSTGTTIRSEVLLRAAPRFVPGK